MARTYFDSMGGRVAITGFPVIHSEVYTTQNGTPYLKEPGVVLLSVPQVNLSGLEEFLKSFDKVDPKLRFGQYLEDETRLPPASKLSKVAGQCCYMSFGPKRTMNEKAGEYLDNILSSGHGSVLEHANFTFLFYGVSRSLTHELVRHRAGCAYSQLSQRYVSGKVLRFVERPEYQNDSELHRRFEERIDCFAQEYNALADYLFEKQQGGEVILSGEARTDLRKKVQQCARSVLPNETETIITMTANVRAWRHIINMRASEHAEVEIRRLFFRVGLCLIMVEPILFSDFTIASYPDGTQGTTTPYPKV